MRRDARPFGSLALWGILTVLPMAAAFLFSGQDGETSGSLSAALARWLLSWLLPGSSPALFQTVHIFIRKAAHFTLYAVMGTGLGGLYLRQNRFPVFPAAVLTAALYAGTDEFHQSFVAERGPSLRDVALDSCGAAAGCGAVLLLYHLWRRRTRREREGHLD